MSELSERVAREHRWTLVDKVDRDGDPYVAGGCTCGVDLDADGDDGIEHTEHVTAATEAAVREAIAARLDGLASLTGGIDRRKTLRDAARIARGES